jgi:A/G-specific adenine glycosylase
MELGALVCVPADPACLLCPVRSRCRAWAEGGVARYPVRGRRRKAPVVEGVCLIARRDEKVLFVQRPEKGLLGGLWEFPTADLRRRQARAPAVRDFLWKGLGLRGEVGRSIGSVRHVFTHRDLRLHLYTVDVAGGRARTEAYPAHRWVNLSEVRHYPLSALTEKVFARLARPAAKGRTKERSRR